MTDLVAADVTNLHSGTTVTTGRKRDVWGAHEVGLYRIALSSSAPAGGFSFDPKTYGFQGIPGAVFIERAAVVANATTLYNFQFFYDYVNKKIIPGEVDDSYNDGSGEDLSTIWLNVLVVSE
jgi:hypothetical protein